MIVVQGGSSDDQLAVFCSADEPDQVRNILESMLGSRVNPKTPGVWGIPVCEFPVLRERLDRLGRTGGREMDERAEAAIRAYERLLDTNEQIKRGELNGDIEAYLQRVAKKPLWPDQIADVRFCLRHLRAGVFSEMGTGKTLILLITFALLKLAGLARHALLVCPNGVKQNWVRQIGEHTWLSTMELGNGAGQVGRRLDEYVAKRTDILITHYDALRSNETRDKICAVPFDVVVLDEAHAIKNYSSTKATKREGQMRRTAAMFDALNRIRCGLQLVEALVELDDGTTMRAILPAGCRPGDTVEFW